jgi:hypothetical protein
MKTLRRLAHSFLKDTRLLLGKTLSHLGFLEVAISRLKFFSGPLNFSSLTLLHLFLALGLLGLTRKPLVCVLCGTRHLRILCLQVNQLLAKTCE